ncbi:MAG: M6 family metalloprotease domain-containing protein, partial [Candidatus Zixiibacteriota bacterium]
MKPKALRWITIQIVKLVLFTFCTGLAMPPHPDLTEQFKQGKVAVPYLIQQSSFQERGINSPTYHPVNSLYRKGTAPFGEFKPLVLLVDFSDNISITDPEYFDSLIFSQESNSVGDYYREISYGNLNIIPTDLPSDIGWLRAPQTYDHYVNYQHGLGYYPYNSQKLVEDLVGLVDSMIDLSQYDNDSDGLVDAVVVIHSGSGAELTGNPSDMWSHKWSLPLPLVSGDGVAVRDYTIQPEYWYSSSDMTIGVFCHELGHIFGLPDLYDIDGDSKGIGEWSVMAYGSWNGYSGSSPAHPDAWCRYKLGFTEPIVICDNFLEMAVPAVERVDAVYKLWSFGESGNEYFLVENRQKIGYDSHLSASGILIWHVDETISYNNCQWYPGYTQYGHYKVALKQADGLWQLEKSINRGDTGDPFPGSSVNFNFNSTSSPNSYNYLEGETCVSVNNIS